VPPILPDNSRALLFPLMMLCCMLSPMTAASAGFEVLTTAPASAFSLPDLRDREHGLADYRGKVVLVNFWASWCPPCIYEMPELVRLQQRYADRPFVILAVNAGEKKYKVRKFVNLVRFELPVLLDTTRQVSRDWGAETLPTSYLVDAKGRVRYSVHGSPGWEQSDTLALLENLLSETGPAPASGSNPDRNGDTP
jgi:thiol-disulfide isomerase/thioredoxin